MGRLPPQAASLASPWSVTTHAWRTRERVSCCCRCCLLLTSCPVGRAPPPGPTERGLPTADRVPGCPPFLSTRKIGCFWASLAGQRLGLRACTGLAPGLHRHGPSSIPGWKWRSRKPRRAHPECCFLQPWVSGRATWPHAPSPGQAASPLLRQHPVFTLTSDYLCPGVCAVPESCSASSTCRFVSSTESADVVSRCFFEPLPSARRSQTRTRPHLLSSPPSVLSHVRWLSDFILLLSLSSEFVSLLRRICPNVCGTACDARLGV